jgi:ribosomal protein L29
MTTANPNLPEARSNDLQDQISRLERELAELRASLPAHSIPPSMVMRIEELEDELATLQSAEPTNRET